MLNIKQALTLATNTLETKLVAAPKLDAEILLAFHLGVDRNFLITDAGKELSEKTLDSYLEIVDLRGSGVPTPYITGRQDFMGLTFLVNENVLIPRPDTETLVEQAISVYRGDHWSADATPKIPIKKPKKILEIGTGSGAIAVSLARELPNAIITATDISEEALKVARKNALSAGVAGQIKFICGDTLKPFEKGKIGKFGIQKFDLIISNPPYIPTDVIPTLQREVADHEPKIALDGGVDGLDFYREIIGGAHINLKKGGVLMLEIGHDQAEDVIEIFRQAWKYEGVQCIKDLAGNDRVIFAKMT